MSEGSGSGYFQAAWGDIWFIIFGTNESHPVLVCFLYSHTLISDVNLSGRGRRTDLTQGDIIWEKFVIMKRIIQDF